MAFTCMADEASAKAALSKQLTVPAGACSGILSTLSAFIFCVTATPLDDEAADGGEEQDRLLEYAGTGRDGGK